MEKSLIEQVNGNIQNGNHKEAVETILEEMRSLAEESGDVEVTNSINKALSIIFDIPNIDWNKAKKELVWEIKK